jgi:hypothetical protein
VVKESCVLLNEFIVLYTETLTERDIKVRIYTRTYICIYIYLYMNMVSLGGEKKRVKNHQKETTSSITVADIDE